MFVSWFKPEVDPQRLGVRRLSKKLRRADQHDGFIFNLVNEDLHALFFCSESENFLSVNTAQPRARRTELYLKLTAHRPSQRRCNFTAAVVGVVGERTLGGGQCEGQEHGRSWSAREWWDQDAERRRTGMVYTQETRESQRRTHAALGDGQKRIADVCAVETKGDECK
ncbi:hypothetical protein B0H13DRAFT_1903356 [Mycena leptocephala]|nr:hypothetical protein B0H13DRAFT_1903356 [Mycena leptocephala]